jgi:hypothetical protein
MSPPPKSSSGGGCVRRLGRRCFLASCFMRLNMMFSHGRPSLSLPRLRRICSRLNSDWKTPWLEQLRCDLETAFAFTIVDYFLHATDEGEGKRVLWRGLSSPRNAGFQAHPRRAVSSAIFAGLVPGPGSLRTLVSGLLSRFWLPSLRSKNFRSRQADSGRLSAWPFGGGSAF